jgi:hypothetical protein
LVIAWCFSSRNRWAFSGWVSNSGVQIFPYFSGHKFKQLLFY